MLSLSGCVLSLATSFDTVMRQIVGKAYLVRVEDLKPIRPEELGDTCDPEEFIYLVGAEIECVRVADVGISRKPKLDQASQGHGFGQGQRFKNRPGSQYRFG